jgi:O-antigen/teichoic acid export membrane protein
MFWRGVIGYLPANLVQAAVGLATIVLFTRLLTPEQYGQYAVGFSLMTLAHTLIFTWNEAAMARFWAGEEMQGRAKDHLATIYRTWLVLLIALPMAALAAFAVPMKPDLKLAALAGLASVLPRTLCKLVQERQRAAGEVRGAVALDIGQTLGGFLAGVALAWAGLGGAAPLWGMGGAALLCLVFAAPGEWRRTAGGRFEAERARRYGAFGAPVALSLVLALVLSTTDRFLIAAFLNEAQVGVYHAGYSLANRTLDVAFIWLGAASGPALIMALERGGPATLREQARDQAGLMVLITLPAAVGLALVARPLSEVLVGPELRAGAAQVTPWIAASAFLSGVTTYYFAQAFTLSHRTGRLLVAMAIPAGANVILNLLLIPQLGLTGAMAATVISYALGLAASLVLGRGTMALPIPWRTLGEAVVGATVMALAVSLAPELGGVLELGVKAGLGALVYGLVVFVLDAGALRSRAGAAFRLWRAGTAA